MIEILDGVISEILKSAFAGAKEHAQYITKSQFGLKKYLSNLYPDLNQVQLHRSNETKEISKIFVDLKFLDVVLSERYFIDFKALMSSPSQSIRNPKSLLRKESVSENDYKTKEQILGSYQKLIFLGQPGCGKTTIVKKIILDQITSEKLDRVPVYVPLRNSKLNEQTIKEFISEQFEKYGIEKAKSFVERLLKKGRLLIALDGIDEIPKENKRNILDQIISLASEHPDNIYLATTRASDYKGELKPFKEVEICDFEQKDVKEFIVQWFSPNPKMLDYKTLINKIEEFPQIAEIATSPLLLSLICIVYEYDLEISARRTTLYKRCVECLLRDWDAQRNFRRNTSYSKLDDPKKITLLSQLAYCLHSEQKIYFENLHLKKYLENSIENYGLEKTSLMDIIDEIKSHYGFILEVSKDVYSFSHLTFQEFFTANYVVNNNTWRKEIDEHLEDAFWQEVFILASSLFSDGTSYIEYIFNKESSNKQNLIIAGLCLSVDPIIDRELKEKIVNSILYEYNNYTNKAVRLKCLYTISKIDATFVGKTLLDSLGVGPNYLEQIRKSK